jgi:hypothetical protein
MDFTGLWKFDGTDETLEITCPVGSERHVFEYSSEHKTNENVAIFLADHRYARLAHSQVFGRADIFIVNKDTFLIDDQRFTRIAENKRHHRDELYAD